MATNQFHIQIEDSLFKSSATLVLFPFPFGVIYWLSTFPVLHRSSSLLPIPSLFSFMHTAVPSISISVSLLPRSTLLFPVSPLFIHPPTKLHTSLRVYLSIYLCLYVRMYVRTSLSCSHLVAWTLHLPSIIPLHRRGARLFCDRLDPRCRCLLEPHPLHHIHPNRVE